MNSKHKNIIYIISLQIFFFLYFLLSACSKDLPIEDLTFIEFDYINGDTCYMNFSINNHKGYNKDNIDIRYYTSSALIPLTQSLRVQNEDTFIVSCYFKILSGGGNTPITVKLFNNEEFIGEDTKYVFIDRPGWYSGDTHTHSIYSDGNNTINKNMDISQKKGLSFIFATDHNTINHYQECARLSSNTFLVLPGIEVTTSYGHILALFSEENINFSTVSSLNSAQNIINDINKNNGLSFIAHPFLNTMEWRWKDTENMNGIEVWNLYPASTSKETAESMKWWDEKLCEGKIYYASTGSDTHETSTIAASFIGIYLEKLSKGNIYKSIKNGMFYCSNGPEIYIEAEGKKMGEICNVGKGRNINLDIKGAYSLPMKKIRIIKNGKEFLEYNINDNLKTITIEDFARHGDYYRAEVTTENNGFAFTNPIFIRE